MTDTEMAKFVFRTIGRELAAWRKLLKSNNDERTTELVGHSIYALEELRRTLRRALKARIHG